MDRTYSPINNLLEQATCIAKRSKEAAGTLEPTEGYKRRQTEELIKFANDNGLWIDLSHLNITYMDRGGENEVFRFLHAFHQYIFRKMTDNDKNGIPVIPYMNPMLNSL